MEQTRTPASIDSPLRCPLCVVAMLPEEKHSLSLDRCPQCRGLWFDHPELHEYVRNEGRTVRQSLPNLVRLPDAGSLECPRCAGLYLEAWRSGATYLSRCRQCSGVFLDQADIRALGGNRPVYGIPAPLGSTSTGPEWIEIPLEVGLEIVLRALVSWL